MDCEDIDRSLCISLSARPHFLQSADLRGDKFTSTTSNVFGDLGVIKLSQLIYFAELDFFKLTLFFVPRY